MQSLLRRIRHPWITHEPAFQIVVVELFAPQQPSEGLSLNELRVLGQMCRSQVFIELIGFLNPLFKESIDVLLIKSSWIRFIRQTKTNDFRFPS